MKTNQVMKRDFLGGVISQRTDNGYLSATDLFLWANKWRVANDLEPVVAARYYRNRSTKELIDQIEKEGIKPRYLSKGKNSHTWVHPILFIDMALTLSPKLKLQVYKWIKDNLLLNRKLSCASYKLMTGSLFNNTKAPSKFGLEMINTSNKIKKAVGVSDWNSATEEQLQLRDKIHEAITMISNILKDNKKAVDLGIYEVLENNKKIRNEK